MTMPSNDDLSALFGGGDMSGLLAQAQAFQAQMERAQAELAAMTLTGSAGGDLVEATLTGDGELTKITIKPEAVDVDDLESLEDLVVAAVRDGMDKVAAAARATMGGMPGMGM